MVIGKQGMMGVRGGASVPPTTAPLPASVIARWEYRNPLNTISNGKFTRIVDSAQGLYPQSSSVLWSQISVGINGDGLLNSGGNMSLLNPIVDDGSDEYVFYYWLRNPYAWVTSQFATTVYAAYLFRENRYGIAQLMSLTGPIFPLGKLYIRDDWVNYVNLQIPPSGYVLMALVTTRSTDKESLYIFNNQGTPTAMGTGLRRANPRGWDDITRIGDRISYRNRNSPDMRVAEVALARGAVVDIQAYYNATKGNYGL